MDELLETQYQRYVDQGDAAALERLVVRCRPVLLRLARRLGHVPEDSEDLVQETLITAFERAHRYDRSRPLLPWLKGILTHRAATLTRSSRRRAAHIRVQSALLEPVSEGEDASIGTQQVDPSAVAATEELVELLRESLAEMPDKYGLPLELHLLSGMDPIDIATQLDETRSTVRVRLHRGLKLLRGQLPAGLAGSLLVAVMNRKAVAAGLSAGIGWSVLCWTAAAVGAAAAITVVTVALTHGGNGETGGDSRTATAIGTTDSAALSEATDERRSLVMGPDVARHEPASVVVEVVDEFGKGLPHVGVVLMPAGGVDPILTRRRGVTDASGLCELARATDGPVKVWLDRGPEESHILNAAGDSPLRVSVTGGLAISGRVVDGRGRGVTGASIWLSEITGGPWRGIDVTVTDSAGRFALEAVRPGSFVAARAPGYCRSDVVRVREGLGEEVVLVLDEKGGQVDGIVLDDEGSTVQGALVFVGESLEVRSFRMMRDASAWRPPPFETRSSESGSFSTLGLEEGIHPLVVLAPGHVPHGSTVSVSAGRSTTVEVRLAGGARVSGVIRNERGEPIHGARVAFRGIDYAAEADILAVDGTFWLDCIPRGAALLGALAEGYNQAAKTLEIDDADTVRAIDLVLTRPVSLRGLLIDVQGSPGKRYLVRGSYPPPNSLAPGKSLTRTDDFGEFSLDLPDSLRPRLDVRRQDEPLWHDVSSHVTWTESGAQILLPERLVPSAWLSGRILDARSRPFSGATLHVRLDGQPFHVVGHTGAGGDFRVGPLIPGGYTIFAETTRSDMPSAEVGRWLLSAAEDLSVEATLEQTGRLKYHLYREDGQPIHDLVLTLNRDGFPERTSLGGSATGHQELVPGEGYRLVAMGANVQWLMCHPFTIRAGETTEVRVALEPGVHRRLVLSGFPAAAMAESDTAEFEVIRLADGVRVWGGVMLLDISSSQPLLMHLPVGKFELWFATSSGRRYHGWFEVENLRPRFSAIKVKIREL